MKTEQKEMKEQMKEHWLPLLHCARHKDGKAMYEVSNYGNVRRITKDGFKPVRTYPNHEGYLVVRILNGNYMRQWFFLARLVAVTFIPNPNGWDTVDHIDGNIHNNCIRNLRWVSRGENISLAHRAGRIKQNFPQHPVKIEKGNRVHAFRTMSRAAFYLECSIHAVQQATRGDFKIKGWTVTSLVSREVNGNLFND